MHPEREVQNIQKNNPLTDELKEQILSIEGVEKVEESFFAGALIKNIEELKEDDGAPLDSGISGVSDELIEAAEKYVTKGSLEDPKLRNGTGAILGEGYITHYTDLTVGDVVEVKLKDGDKLVPKSFEIVAVVDAPNSMLGNSLTVPEKALQDMCEQDLTDQFDIFIESSHYEEAERAIEELIANQEYLEMSDYRSIYKEMEKSIGMLSYMGYGMLGVFGLIGILKSGQYNDQQCACAKKRAWNAAGNRHVRPTDRSDASIGRTCIYSGNADLISWSRKSDGLCLILKGERRRNVRSALL